MKYSVTSRLFTVLFLIIALISCKENNQTADKDKERIDKLCEQFMQTFSEGKIENALELLKQNTAMSAATIDTLQITIAYQMKNTFAAYGKMLAAEFIVEHKIKNLIAKRFYILKFEKYYLKFAFTLYKGGQGWTVTEFNYNDDLMEVLY